MSAPIGLILAKVRMVHAPLATLATQTTALRHRTVDCRMSLF